jgi:hypothetical protein
MGFGSDAKSAFSWRFEPFFFSFDFCRASEMPTKPLFEGGLKYPSEALDSCKLIAYHHVDETPAARPGYPLRAGRDWPDKSARVD